MHADRHPLAGETVKLNDSVAFDSVQNAVVPGALFRVEDWWDRLTGGSWATANGNPAAIQYALRISSAFDRIPPDDEVVYGKIDHLGHLVHVSELGDAVRVEEK